MPKPEMMTQAGKVRNFLRHHPGMYTSRSLVVAMALKGIHNISKAAAGAGLSEWEANGYAKRQGRGVYVVRSLGAER